MHSDPIVLLHGSANGSYSWGPIRAALTRAGHTVVAPDMLGYGASPAPSDAYTIAEELEHLRRVLDQHGVAAMHLVAHSLGSLFALHLRLALGDRVRRLTLIDPVVVSVLREPAEAAALAEMEAVYQAFIAAVPDPPAAARLFVEHWNGPGTWDRLGERARAVITSLVPRLHLEISAMRDDPTTLAALASTVASPRPPTAILVGEHTRLGPRAAARQLARAFDAAVQVVPGAGHMIPLTHAAAVVAALA